MPLYIKLATELRSQTRAQRHGAWAHAEWVPSRRHSQVSVVPKNTQQVMLFGGLILEAVFEPIVRWR